MEKHMNIEDEQELEYKFKQNFDNLTTKVPKKNFKSHKKKIFLEDELFINNLTDN